MQVSKSVERCGNSLDKLQKEVHNDIIGNDEYVLVNKRERPLIQNTCRIDNIREIPGTVIVITLQIRYYKLERM